MSCTKYYSEKLKEFHRRRDANIELFCNKLSDSDWQGDLLSRNEVVQLVKEEKSNCKVCHIVGSGCSLNTSKNFISRDDFVIGFNYAALSGIDFNVYFFEFGGRSVIKTSENHLLIAKELVSKNTNLVFFKNLWESKNDLDFIRDNWLGLATPIMDIIYPTVSEDFIPYVIESCFEASDKYLPQYKSSIMTSIFVAYQSGFEKIVLHGLDFGGLYFYDEFIDSSFIRYKPDGVGEQGNYASIKPGEAHVTATGINSMQRLIPIAHEYLASKGVELYSAVSSSPSSSLLPVFYL